MKTYRSIAFLIALLIMAFSGLEGTESQEALSAPYIYHSVNVMTGSYVEASTDLALTGPHPLVLRRCYQSQAAFSADSSSGWLTNLPSLFMKGSEETAMPNPSIQCEYDDEGRLASVHTFDPVAGRQHRAIKFTYSERDGELTCQAEADDHTLLHYRYKIDRSSHKCPSLYLVSVEKNQAPLVSYEYQAHPLTRSLLISRREEPNGRYLMAEYYDQPRSEVGDAQVELAPGDFRWGRVKLLKAPVGSDATPIITHRFFYGEGWTEVRDALNHRVVYRYSDFHRLTAIEYYDEEDSLYRVERFNWKMDASTGMAPLMCSRSLEDGAGRVVSGHSFEYDKGGHLVKDEVWGCLTGACEEAERSATRYQYDGYNIVYKQEGEHLSVNYAYDSDKRLIFEHQVVDGSLHLRTFYEYDCNGCMIGTVEDDGKGKSQEDLTGVHQRRITRILPSTMPTSFGLPLSVEESYWDFEAQLERPVSKILSEYADSGQLSHQQVFDGMGRCLKDVSYMYDRAGRLHMECVLDGEVTTFEYDANGNVTSQKIQKPDGAVVCKNRQYDFANRLIRSEESSALEAPLAVSFRYNWAGLKIAESQDGKGTTSYQYDAMGRLIRLCQPQVHEGEGSVAASFDYQYDVSDQVCSSMDANGWITKARYNVRGKPIEIEYADGTTEQFQYNLAGFVVKQKSRIGLTITHVRDGLGRSLKTVVSDSLGEPISVVSCSYTTFNLLTQDDALGRSQYSYDGAGRVIALEEHVGGNARRTEFLYDEQGRVSEKKNLFGEEEVRDLFIYAESDQPVAVHTVDGQGNVLHISAEKGAAPSTTFSVSRLVPNACGQEVRHVEEGDMEGNIVKTLYDVMGRPKTVSRYSSFRLLSHVDYCYDAVGNKVKEVHHNGDRAAYVLEWKFGVGNRLETFIEGAGSEKQRITTYEYNPIGLLAHMTKPDGTVMSYSYFPSGQIQELFSSDGTVHYRYQYDDKGNISAICDRLTGAVSSRQYTPSNQLSVDKLATGYTLKYDYNQRGQKEKLLLPDGSSVAYAYQGRLLKEIHRLNQEKALCYSHIYQAYNNGKVERVQLAGGFGELRYQYDEAGKLESLSSPYWSEKIKYNSSGYMAASAIEDSAGAHTSAYSYHESGALAAENGVRDAEYGYDSFGNDKTAQVDPLNQLSSFHGLECTYDANGNLATQIVEGCFTTLAYDALNRLIHVQQDSGVRVAYVYDGFNRRIQKQQFSWDRAANEWVLEQTESYLYENMCEIGALNADGEIVQLRLLGNGLGAEIGAAVAIELRGEAYTPLHDSRGNVAALISHKSQAVVECYRYTAFGESSVYDQAGEALQVSGYQMPWGFSSKRLDPETGWIYFGLRHYDPAAHRWTTPDPLGHLDGPNRYAYAHNNPVMNHDFFGEFTVGEVWHSCFKMLKHGIGFLQDGIHWCQQKAGYVSLSQDEIEALAHTLVGPFLLRMVGYYQNQLEVGVLGEGEINDKVRVTMINGILNVQPEYIQAVGLFSKLHGGVNIHFIYRPSNGWAQDLLQCVLSKAGVISPQSRLLARTWKSLIREMGGVDGGGLIIHYAHSIGGTESSNTKRLLTPAEKKMIKMITLGSATLIQDKDFQSVVNYVSWRDGVSYFDPIHYIRTLLNKETNVHLIGSLWGIPLIDHLVDNPSYLAIITMLGDEFVRTYGALSEP